MKLICTQKERENIIIELTKREAMSISIDIGVFKDVHNLRKATLDFKEVLEEGIKRIEGDSDEC